MAGNGQEERLYRARYLIGADGPNSKVVRTLYPEYREAITWFTVKQHLHEIIDCPLDPAYFHYWFHPGAGLLHLEPPEERPPDRGRGA